MGESAYYAAYYAVDVEEAAARLQETPDRVREMLATGELEGILPGATAQGDWKVLLPATSDQVQPASPDEDLETPADEQEQIPLPHEGTEESVERPETAADAEESPAASDELTRGDGAEVAAEPTAPSGWVSIEDVRNEEYKFPITL